MQRSVACTPPLRQPPPTTRPHRHLPIMCHRFGFRWRDRARCSKGLLCCSISSVTFGVWRSPRPPRYLRLSKPSVSSWGGEVGADSTSCSRSATLHLIRPAPINTSAAQLSRGEGGGSGPTTGDQRHHSDSRPSHTGSLVLLLWLLLFLALISETFLFFFLNCILLK